MGSISAALQRRLHELEQRAITEQRKRVKAEQQLSGYKWRSNGCRPRWRNARPTI
jgi:hypothetical protein